jgi:hypothetical protein
MSSAQRVVQKFGSQTKLAEALGTNQSTIGYWVKTGNIPAKWHAEILGAAQREGLRLDPADLINKPTVPEPDAPALPIARYSGPLTVQENSLPVSCYVLSTGQRIISRVSAVDAIASEEEFPDARKGGDLEKYLRPVQMYLRRRLEDELIEFRIDNVTNKRVMGITAEMFLEICRAFTVARNEGALTTDRQIDMAIRCNAFLVACATVGLIALIDEATGYQYERAADALQVKLRAFLEDEMHEWEKTFPDDLWKEFGRLTNWEGSIQQRPKYWGKLVMELVYEYLDADVAQWLRTNAPKPRHGQNYHQWLSQQYGLQKLIEHIWMLIGIASTCSNMTELRYRMAEKFGRQGLQLWLFVEPPK